MKKQTKWFALNISKLICPGRLPPTFNILQVEMQWRSGLMDLLRTVTSVTFSGLFRTRVLF